MALAATKNWFGFVRLFWRDFEKHAARARVCIFTHCVVVYMEFHLHTRQQHVCKENGWLCCWCFWLAAPVWAMMPWMRRRRTGGVLMESGDKKTTRDFYKTSLEMKYLPYQRVQDLFQQYMGTIFATFFLADLCHSNRTCFGKTCPPAWNL